MLTSYYLRRGWDVEGRLTPARETEIRAVCSGLLGKHADEVSESSSQL